MRDFLKRLAGCFVLASMLAISVQAQQSWIWSRDDNSRPINLKTDSISILVLESRVPSGDNFLAHDSAVGLLVDTKFVGSTAENPQASRDFPFMFEETADELNDHNHRNSKELSDQEVLINYFPLEDGKTIYRSISISLTLLRKQDPAVWTGVFKTLLSATKDVALPSPLTVGVNYLNTFSTDVLNRYLPDPNKEKRIDLGTFSFLLSDKPSELNRVTETGLHLRIFPPTGTGPGWVDPDQWDSYCFYTKFSSSNWAVMVSRKDDNAPDKDAEGCPTSGYTPLMNDYVPILIEAEQTPGLAAKAVQAEGEGIAMPFVHLLNMQGVETETQALSLLQSRAEDMRKAALRECTQFRIPNSKCPANKEF